MGRTLCVLAALLLAAATFSAASARAGRDSIDADDLTVLRAHNADAHLLALWRLGQPDTAATLVAEQAEALYAALREDDDWRVRWLAAEALAQARGTYTPPEDANPNAFYNPPRFLDYSLNRWLTNDSVYVREAAARGVTAEQPGERYKVTSEMVRALGDESKVVRELVTGHVGRIILANPAVVRDLLWQYVQADKSQYTRAEDFLKSQSYMGHPDAEAGRELLDTHIGQLRTRQYQIRTAFSRAGAAAMPALLAQWEQEPRLHEEILDVWTTMSESAGDAGPLLAQVLADQQSPLWWTALRAAERIRPPNREELALLMLPRVCCAVPSYSVICSLERLGPLPDSVAQPVIDQIRLGTDKELRALINMLGSIGPQSELVYGFLTELAQDASATDEEREAALHALVRMAREGNSEAALFVLEATADDDKRRGSALHTMLWDDQLLNYPEVVAVLADGIGAAELVLIQPELLGLPEFAVIARQAVTAEVTDPKTSPARIIRLAPLLTRFDPPLVELGAVVAEQFEYAGSSSGDYARALAALNPERAHELYLGICESDEHRDSALASALLEGLGAEAEPLLELLAARLLGEQVHEEYARYLADPGDKDYPWGLRPDSEHELSSYSRRRLVLAIGACGPAAAPYARQLLWALKQACYERSLATVPVSVLSRPPEYLDRELDRSHRPHDALIEALAAALVAAGPEALDAVLRVAHGQLNDGATRMGTYGEYRNPGYDRRLRITALTIVGELRVSDEEAARLLASALYADGSLTGMWYRSDDELDSLRRIAAAKALGKLGVASDEVAAALLEVARGEDAAVRAAVVNALRMLAGWDYSLGEE